MSDLNDMTEKLKATPVKPVPFKANPALFKPKPTEKRDLELLLQSESEEELSPQVYTQQEVPCRKLLSGYSDDEASDQSAIENEVELRQRNQRSPTSPLHHKRSPIKRRSLSPTGEHSPSLNPEKVDKALL